MWPTMIVIPMGEEQLGMPLTQNWTPKRGESSGRQLSKEIRMRFTMLALLIHRKLGFP